MSTEQDREWAEGFAGKLIDTMMEKDGLCFLANTTKDPANMVVLAIEMALLVAIERGRQSGLEEAAKITDELCIRYNGMTSFLVASDLAEAIRARAGAEGQAEGGGE